jgi:hypothetical protein
VKHARIAVCLALLATLVVACDDLRVKEGVYTNMAEARADGAVSAGRVPGALPADAADLRVGYVPDGRHWGVFTFKAADVAAVRALIGAEITAAPPSCDPPGRLEWWPKLVRSPIDVARVNSTGFHLYGARTPGLVFVINWGQGRAYYFHN